MEAEFLAWLRGQLPTDNRVPLGLSDDAAVLRTTEQTIVTVDMLTEGVDFVLAEVDPRRIGRKALAVNLSDMAAMAARPVAAVIALALPRQGGFELAKAVYEGLLPMAADYDLAIAGGDTNTWDGPLVISVTIFGEPTERGVLRRSGARPGDQILVTGSFGGSILGRHFDFQPRVREALLLNDRYELHAGMDVSDGLSLDLSRLARESGCGALLDLTTVPIDIAAFELSARRDDGLTPLAHALGDGEDFELLLAAPVNAAAKILEDQPLSVPITRIGEFVAEPGLWKLSAGHREPLAARGFEH